jgi:hypothetical protein
MSIGAMPSASSTIDIASATLSLFDPFTSVRLESNWLQLAKLCTSQRELSARLRRRNNYIQAIESGEQSVKASELVVIAHACDADPADLLAQAIRASKGK